MACSLPTTGSKLVYPVECIISPATIIISPSKNTRVTGSGKKCNAEEHYRQFVTVVIPERLNDKSHFGYVLWKACQLKKIEIDVNELD